MPDPNERHGRGSWEWATFPARSQQRARAAGDDPARKALPSKVKKGKCKGPDGWHPEHDLAFVMSRTRQGTEARPCGWGAVQVRPWNDGQYEARWCCRHEERCARCDHLEREGHQVSQGCPDFALHAASSGTAPPAAVVAEAVRKTRESRERRAEWTASRLGGRPAVTGPQGYRKRRAAQDGS